MHLCIGQSIRLGWQHSRVDIYLISLLMAYTFLSACFHCHLLPTSHFPAKRHTFLTPSQAFAPNFAAMKWTTCSHTSEHVGPASRLHGCMVEQPQTHVSRLFSSTLFDLLSHILNTTLLQRWHNAHEHPLPSQDQCCFCRLDPFAAEWTVF